jgi:transcription initiation factor TFIIIB Brf1 subunit/transcription initiation factor TFIIB
MEKAFSSHISKQFFDDNDELFNQFTDQILCGPDVDVVQYNYCPDCKFPMELSNCEYQCKYCGLTVKNDMGDINKTRDSVSTVLRAGKTRGKYYTVNNDYSRTQYNVIFRYLMQKLYASPGAFPINILRAVAEQYNLIQKYITEDEYDDKGTVTSQRKFVRRGGIRNEVLAALVKFECKREGLNRKDKSIAHFMNLSTEGFSRGEGLVRDFEAAGKIDLPVNEEPIDGFIDRYLESLNLDNPIYADFIRELVNRSEDRKLGMNSQISSKVAGAIWIIIRNCKLDIAARSLEKATDNTKKNTFNKFYDVVLNNRATFADIFTKYNIP